MMITVATITFTRHSGDGECNVDNDDDDITTRGVATLMKRIIVISVILSNGNARWSG